MEIETFEQTEVSAETGETESSEEQLKLATELGLKGQLELANPETGIFPYRLMTEDERSVYSRVFATKVEASRYNAGPIPLRVLQVLAHAKQVCGDLVRGFSVWYQPTVSVRDPLLVGDSKTFQQFYLLARWGDALRPFDELRKEAGEKHKRELSATLRRISSEVARDLAVVDGSLPVDCLRYEPPNYFNNQLGR